ncbi:MAG: N-6 DNA methylase, partial [Flammeovirgaceae bacterium]
MDSFMGFGFLKELLNPLEDTETWPKADLQFLPQITRIHELLRQLYGDKGYKEAFESLKGSVLTSYFTPKEVVESMVNPLLEHVGEYADILEPSAGAGAYVDVVREVFPLARVTALEKEITTAKFLQKRHPEVEVVGKALEQVRNKKYDLVVSNIPFGSIAVYDAAIYDEAKAVKVSSCTRIHNYFFVKGLDNLKEGGLLVFLTSTGVMDSENGAKIREHLVRNSDLVCAYRLPNNIFESIGTLPTTDVVVLRKNSAKKFLSPEDTRFIKVEKIILGGEQLSINSYYSNNGQNVLGRLVLGGQYSGKGLDCESDGKSISEVCASLREGLARGLERMERAEKVISVNTVASAPEGNIALPLELSGVVKLGNLVVVGDKVGVVELHDEGHRSVKLLPQVKDIERVSALASIRNLFNRLVEAELGSDDKMDSLRKKLNEEYDQFVFRFDRLHHTGNKKLLSFDTEGFKLLSLEVYRE